MVCWSRGRVVRARPGATAVDAARKPKRPRHIQRTPACSYSSVVHQLHRDERQPRAAPLRRASPIT
eukprot:31169-Pelagococcus_subviridis.AAC.6